MKNQSIFGIFAFVVAGCSTTPQADVCDFVCRSRDVCAMPVSTGQSAMVYSEPVMQPAMVAPAPMMVAPAPAPMAVAPAPVMVNPVPVQQAPMMATGVVSGPVVMMEPPPAPPKKVPWYCRPFQIFHRNRN